MILQALAEYSPVDALPPMGYARKRVGFILTILQDPLGCQLTSTYSTDSAGHRISWEDAVPDKSRSNNPPPLLACDTAAFVLGLPKEAKKPEDQPREDTTALSKRNSFLELLSSWASTSGDSDAQAAVRWYAAGCPGLAQAVGSLTDSWSVTRLQLDRIAIRNGNNGPLLHQKPSAQEFWQDHEFPSQGGRVERCLVCGQMRPVVDSLPQALVGANIPDTATAQVALVSGNFPAAQRGATGGGLRSAPICASCGVKAVQAFNSLAANPEQRWSQPGDKRATIWWTKNRTCDDVFALLEHPETGVARVFESIQTGTTRRSAVDVDRFYALIFSGNVARLVVRSWIDVPISQAVANVERWFADTATCSPQYVHPTVSQLAKCAGSMVKSQGKWQEDPPEGAFEDLIRVALQGATPSRGLLLAAVARAKAEVHHNHTNDNMEKSITRRRAAARLGLIRLILNRTNLKGNPLTQYLDTTRLTPPYLSGRLFAVRERLQYQASGDVNASIVDRYFARASENPASVDRVLTDLEKQHLKALRRKSKSPGAAIVIDKQISELHAQMGDAPGRLTDAQSAEWVAGYYQQRQYDFAQAEARKTSTPSNDTTITEE